MRLKKEEINRPENGETNTLNGLLIAAAVLVAFVVLLVVLRRKKQK